MVESLAHELAHEGVMAIRTEGMAVGKTVTGDLFTGNEQNLAHECFLVSRTVGMTRRIFRPGNASVNRFHIPGLPASPPKHSPRMIRHLSCCTPRIREWLNSSTP